jgi:hypothetical protein
MHMKAKYTLFRRNGVYYSQDSATGQQKSLRTRDEVEAQKLVNARNEAHQQPALNLHLARAYPQPRNSSTQVQRKALFSRANVGRLGKYSPASTL